MSSSDYGLRKPHPYLFKLAASKISAFPNEIWFIGDNVGWDVEGSRNVGMTPFHYIGKTGNTHVSEAETIRNFDDIIRILKKTES
jgi:putative hydrolase of the HAD superfamily